MTKQIVFLFAIMFFVGCEQKTDIDSLETEIDYLGLSGALLQNVRLQGSNNSESFLQEELNKLAENETFLIPGNRDYLEYSIYLNEDGSVEKVEVLHNNGEPQKTDLTNITRIKKWQFDPVIVNDNKSKVKFDFIFMPEYESHDLFEFLISHEEEAGYDNLHYVEVEQSPAIIGGIEAIRDKIKYPEAAKRAGIQGSVFINAYIDTAGNVVKMKVMRGIGSGCDLAALEAVSKVKFTPATKAGQKVNVQVSIPIKFKLN